MDAMPRLNILFISDEYFPGLGGVEVHTYHLAQALISKGHKCVVMTCMQGEKQGVRYQSNGLKVYYMPTKQIVKGKAGSSRFWLDIILIRNVIIRE